jgi:hypothetical protein
MLSSNENRKVVDVLAAAYDDVVFSPKSELFHTSDAAGVVNRGMLRPLRR